jgi:putative two-component system response regulator
MSTLHIPNAVAAAASAVSNARSQPAARIMIVDDEPVNIKVVRKYLQIAGYTEFITTSEAPRAMEMIRREKPDLILLDVMMPQVSGLKILQEVRSDPDLAHMPVLILTASTDAETKHAALDLGATDFLAKPVDASDLVPRVRNSLVVKAHHDHLARYSNHLEAEVRMRTAELEKSRLQVVHCLARAAEYRDDDTGRHVVRVGKFAGIIARELGFSPEQVSMLEMAAQLHDVGKIGIPDSILLKPGRLDPEEFKLMQHHCEYGRLIILPDAPAHGSARHKRPPGTRPSLLELAADIAFTHHERWDGTGYPSNFAGEQIPLEGRITAVADVFDALASKRPYKGAFPLESCLSIVKDGRGRQFDAAVVDALVRRIGEIANVQQHMADAA